MKKILLFASAFALVLSSCSKDNTESVPVNNGGSIAFTADMVVGTEVTRTHLEEKTYLWDAGDMVGASTLAMPDANIPFITPTGGEKAAYSAVKEDLDYLGDATYYLTYPYNAENKVNESNGTVSVRMSIPAVQRYRANSFATMTAPAIAVVENYEAGQAIKFSPVASYVNVPVNGAGTVKSLSMSIANGDEKLVLNGEGDVICGDDEKYALEINGVTADDANTKVTVDFGNGGLKLDYTAESSVLFVIPANLAIKANTVFTFTATLADDTESEASFTIPATYKGTEFAVNQRLAGKTVTFGLENSVVIRDVESFVKYAYEAATGEGDYEEFYSDGNLNRAVIISDLDFTGYTLDDQVSETTDKEALRRLIDWYTSANGGGIATIAGADIVGDKNGEAPVIKGLKVNGAVCDGGNISNIVFEGLEVDNNGIFAGKSNITDVRLSGATVNAGDAKNAYFVAGAIDGNGVKLTNVEIDGGELAADAAATKSISGTVYATDLNSGNMATIVSYPVSGDDAVGYARTLNVNADLNVDVTGRIFTEGVTAFATVTSAKTDLRMIRIDGELAGFDLGQLGEIAGNSTAFSVLYGDTSLWTGLTAVAFREDEITTAEELAYAVTARENVALSGVNIDLLQKPWVIAAADKTASITVNGAKGLSISNVKIVNSESDDARATYSLFGRSAKVSGLEVNGLVVEIDAKVAKTAYVGGLAYGGSANGVTVNGIDITVAEGAQVRKTVGGLISSASKSSDNVAAGVKIDFAGAVIGGMFGSISGNFDGNTLSDAAGVAVMIGKFTFNADTTVKDCTFENGTLIDRLSANLAGVQPGQVIKLTATGCSVDKLFNGEPEISVAKEAKKGTYIVKINDDYFEHEVK